MSAPPLPPPAPPPQNATPDLRPLAALAARSFASTAEATQAVLAAITAQLGLRTSFLTRTTPADGRNRVLAAHNEPGGSGIVAGADLSLDDTFCGIIVGATMLVPLLIPDTRRDPTFGDHPAVAASPAVGSFLGVPIVLADGTLFGTLCAIDPDPQPLAPGQADLLIVLARLVATQIERDREVAARLEAERARETLLAALAHDLKSPLTTASGLAQLLLRQAAGGRAAEPDALARRLEQIVAAAGRATSLLEEQLDLARARLDRLLALERRPTDLIALARRVASEHAPLAPRHRLRVATDHTDLIASVDASQLERVFANLVANAIKYSPEGGAVVLSLSHEEGEDGPHAVLVVTDAGIGIPAADLAHIGEPFRRGANALGRIPGTGLGLASARRIVAAHGGTLALASVEGAGTTVTVRLPLTSSVSAVDGA